MTPTIPYYAVIFTSIRTEGDNGYSKSGLIERLIRQRLSQPKPTNVLRVK